MANETLARRYASAVFMLAQEQDVIDRVGADLAMLRDSIELDETTREFFLSPVVDRSAKERTFVTAFEGKMHDVALHAVLLLVRKRREALLREIVLQYRHLQLASRGTEPLVVTSAMQLSDAQVASMVGRLEDVFKKKFEVTQHIDPSLIGGVRVTIGDRRIDASIAGRLEELSRTLFARN